MSDVQKWHWIEWSDEYPPLKHFWHWYFRRSCRFSISVPRKISIICRCSMQLGDASFILITNTPFYSSKNLLLIKMIVMRIILPSERPLGIGNMVSLAPKSGDFIHPGFLLITKYHTILNHFYFSVLFSNHLVLIALRTVVIDYFSTWFGQRLVQFLHYILCF